MDGRSLCTCSVDVDRVDNRAAAHKISGSGHVRRCQTVAELDICVVYVICRVSFDTLDAKC